ncbi:hypothetical protein PIGHUM_02884 [Pigmentiphaga humi]|uniref:DUF72 domain-containing protein n=1 Tax=Pigmentiphaga humi TaxID=2478468 RepID=A0A3P4B5J7_9BURK|nr:DUF72 domain-containing protein [Pigmentiphaga humi]VCU70806.1 hypothetical protein PIGHUM_02884 [Pigmentiphaga humi]
MTVRTGTCSWTDPTLLACGRFYPPGVRSAEQRLRHYAARFPLVEVDSSHYRLPDACTAYLWTQRTPPDFLFHVKAFRLFTGHLTPVAALPPDLAGELDPAIRYVDYATLPRELRDETWRRFLPALEPLRQSGQLAAVHMQFAPRVRNDASGRALVRACAARLEDLAPAVEFRHRSWLTASSRAATLALLREAGAVHTVVDSPVGPVNTVPAVWAATHPGLAVVRLHGRNRGAWNRRGVHASSGRFVYEYTPEELAEIAELVARLTRSAANVHVLFNTNHEDQGMRNAAAFQDAYERKRQRVSAPLP